MTNRLNDPMGRLEHLPDADQDRFAETALAMIGASDHMADLSKDHRAGLRKRTQQPRDGSATLASDGEMADLGAH